jgi:hypothetical protein
MRLYGGERNNPRSHHKQLCRSWLRVKDPLRQALPALDAATRLRIESQRAI